MNKNISRAYFNVFELEVCMFINSECRKEETFMHFFQNPQNNFTADGYLPKGCKNLQLPKDTIIEVKPRILPDTISRWVNNIRKSFNHEQKYKFVLIHNSNFGKTDWNFEIEGFDISVISFIELKKRASKSQESFSNAEKKNKEYLDKINKSSESEKNQEIIFESLRSEAAKGNLTLFLGAGVSVSGGLPTWDNLLQNLAKEINTNFTPSILKSQNLDKMKNVSNHSSIIIARYMRVGKDHTRLGLRPKTNNDFNEALYKALYSGIKSFEKKELIISIKKLITEKKVNSVITYNFDDYLEETLAQDNFSFQTIANGGRLTAGNFPIYHVHGLLPIDKNNPNLPNPVLTEESYHQLYQDAYQWSNVEQLHALNNSTCVFIGLSMTDPNLRRLMEISMMKNETDDVIAPHYVFLRRSKFFEDKNNHANDSTDIEDKENRLIIEKMLHELGANVIWYEKHEDLPNLLNLL